MKFNEYLKIQKEFLQFLNANSEVESYFLGAIRALSKASSALLPKNYKLDKKQINDYDKYSKLVDAFKYFLCIFDYYDLDVEKFDEYFKLISIYVMNRYKLKKIIDNQRKYRNIVLLDIDGVLAEFPGYFIRKFNETYNTDYKTYNEIPLGKRNVYKEKYRVCGEKVNIPLCKYAKEFLTDLKTKGYTVILFTNRPIYLYENIIIDTIKWAFINDLQYDAILFSENKMLDVIKNFNYKNIKLYVEDNVSNANSICKLGINTYLIKNNLSDQNISKCERKIKIVESLDQIKLDEVKNDQN